MYKKVQGQKVQGQALICDITIHQQQSGSPLSNVNPKNTQSQPNDIHIEYVLH